MRFRFSEHEKRKQSKNFKPPCKTAPKGAGLPYQICEILVKDKKQNHSINVDDLNKVAQDRLAAKYIEAESLISLRITGNHRLYVSL